MCARQTRMLSNQRLPPLQPGVYGVAKPRNRAEQTEISLPSRLCASVGVGWITPPYSRYIKTHVAPPSPFGGPRYSGSKPQRRFSRGKNIKDAESLDKLMLRGGGNRPVLRNSEERTSELKHELLWCIAHTKTCPRD